MKVVTVIPLARGIFKDTLAYWSGKDVTPGALVTVPVQNRRVNALVVSVEDIGDAKMQVKKSPFALKKIDTVRPNFLSGEFISAAERLSRYAAAPVGAVLQALVPKVILEAPPNMKAPIGAKKERSDLKIEKLAFQSEDAERLTAYRSLIREEFARKGSIFMCLPTREEAERFAAALRKGISEYVFVLHGGIAKKKLLADWQRAAAETHPVLIVATPSFLSIPRNDIRVIVAERESSSAYRTIARPEIDLRQFSEYYAEERGAKLILGDMVLRTETLHRYFEHELTHFTSVKSRLLGPADGSVIDMKLYRESGGKGKRFTTLSKELKALVELAHRDRGRLAIIVGRRGLAGTTVCSDCGATVLCEKCGAPLVLHEKKSVRIYACHKCGNERKVGGGSGEERCAACQSWRLVPLGIGTERVAEEVRQEFPEASVFRFDSDVIKTEAAAKKTMTQFESASGGILVGTDMAVPYFEKPLNGSALVGIDALLTVPDFRMNEKLFSLISSLRAKTEKTILVQTQEPERELFSYAVRGEMLAFFRAEIAERKAFGYPPFTTLLKISWEAKSGSAEAELAELSARFEAYEPRAYTSSLGGVRGGVKAIVLLKVPRQNWPNDELLAALKALPPRYVVAVDPDNVL